MKRKKLHKIRQKQLESILPLIKQGVHEQEIIDRLGLKMSLATFSHLVNSSGMHYMDLRNQGLRDELDKVMFGEKHLFQVRKQFGLTPFGFFNHVEKMKYLDVFYNETPISGFRVIRDLIRSLKDDGLPNIDSLVRDGFNLVEIANKIGHEPNYVQRYIKGSGQYTIWNARKMQREEMLSDAKSKSAEFLMRYL